MHRYRVFKRTSHQTTSRFHNFRIEFIPICTVIAAIGASYGTRVRDDAMIKMRGDIARLKEDIKSLRAQLDGAGEQGEEEVHEDLPMEDRWDVVG